MNDQTKNLIARNRHKRRTNVFIYPEMCDLLRTTGLTASECMFALSYMALKKLGKDMPYIANSDLEIVNKLRELLLAGNKAVI